MKYLFIIMFGLILPADYCLGNDFQSRPTAGDMNELIEQAHVIRNAVYERGSVTNGAQLPSLPYSGEWQSWFQTLQVALESLAPKFVDNVNGPLSPSGTNFLSYTLSSWRSAADLNAQGFARLTAAGNWAYGLAQAGDQLGAWIYDELQNGGSALQCTVKIGNTADTTYWQGGASRWGGPIEDTIEYVMETTISSYNASETNITSSFYGYYVNAYEIYWNDPVYAWGCYLNTARAVGKPGMSGIPTNLPSSAVIYIRATGGTGDPDGLGYSESLTAFDSLSESTSAVRYSINPITSNTECPALQEDIQFPLEDYMWLEVSGPSLSSEWLLNWNFTD